MRALRMMRNLAGGRIPPLTRTALLCGLAAFILALLLFRPEAPSHGKAPAAKDVATLLSTEDPLTQRTLLLDESLVFLPPSGSTQSSPGGHQFSLEGTPFSGFPPQLRFDPGRRPDLPFETDFSKNIAPLDVINPSKGDPFLTFSSTKVKSDLIRSRPFRCVIKSLEDPKQPSIIIEVGDFPKVNLFKDGFNGLKAIIGVDSLGLLGRPTVIMSSGDMNLDRSFLDWFSGQSWEGRLLPGVFEISVGP